jgi:hypothetical protein
VPGGRQIVDPPAFTPLGFGLLQVAQDVSPTTAGDPHWQQGVTWTSRCVEAGMGSLTYEECIVVTGAGSGPVPPPGSLTGNVGFPDRGATPFTVYTEFDCSPVGNDDALKKAQEALAQTESWQVERAFWTGIAANQPVVWPHLAASQAAVDPQGIILQTAAVVAASGAGQASNPNDVADGLGQLEGVLADCYNGVGVIHVPQFALPSLDAYGLVKATGGVMKTLNGNLVAVGAGYPGTSPTGAARGFGQTWLYATGAIELRRSPVRYFAPKESFDRAENTRKMIAYRTYVIGWDCCHAAVLIGLGTTPAGSA